MAGERVQSPAEADADVARPEAHQPQRLADRRRPPDRAGLLGERQEVRPVARMHHHRHDPPRARDRQRRGEPPAVGQQRPQREPAPAQLVEHEQQRPDQHPARDRHVHAAARGGQHQRERRRPAPAVRVAHAAVHAQQQPRQRRVGQQRDRRAVGIDGHVRVHHEQHRRGCVRQSAVALPHGLHQPHDAPRREEQQRAEPQPLDDPHRDPERVAQPEPRRHREQVAAVLARPDVAEVRGRRPRRRQVAQEAPRIDVQVDLRVGDELAPALGEGEAVREHGEAGQDEAMAGHGAP